MTRHQFKRERARRGTQNAVAALMGVDRMTISRWERGVTPLPKMASKALLTLPVISK